MATNEEKPVEEPVSPATETEPAEEVAEDAEEQETPKGKNSDTKKKKPGRARKVLIGLGISAGLLLVAAGVVWKFKLYKPYWDSYNSGSISIKVKESDKFVVEGAVVRVHDVDYTTDNNGKISIPKLVAGSYTAHVTKDGYTPNDAMFLVKRGDNDLVIVSIEKVPDKLFTLSGVVQDYVSGLPLTDVQVTLSSTTHRTDAVGGYSFEKIAAGDYKLTLSKSGYAEKEVTVTVKDAAVTADAVSLVPRGQLIFVSDRDGGKRGLYVTDYDGANQKAFVTRVSTGEDYGQSISPDGKWVVFSSTRDGVKSSYGNALARLYIVARDGTGLKKVNDDVSTSQLVWSPNSRFFFYHAYSDAAETQGVYRFYDTQKGAILDLGDTGADNVHFSSDGNAIVYTVSQYGLDGNPVYTNFLKYYNVATGDRKTYVTKTGNPFSTAAFSSDDKALEYEQTVDTARHRYQVKLADSSESEIALPAEDAKTYWPSPDGTMKAFLDRRDGKHDLFMVTKDGKNEKRLTKLGVLNENVPVAWDESGHYLTFAVTREGENALYIVSVDGGDPKKITDFSDGSGYPGYY